MEIENDGVDGEAVALISKIRYLSVYSAIYSVVLIPVLLLWDISLLYKVIAWSLCGVFILGGLWAYCLPSRTNLLILGIGNSLGVLYGAWLGIYALCAGIVFAVLYFARFWDIRKTPVSKEDLNHIRVLKQQFKPRKPGDLIRITVITLVDRRVWKCIFEEEQLMIHSQYRDETHVGRREDVRILGSNIKKPRIHVRFTLRMNGEIYRCKANRLAFYKLDRWIEGSRWETADTIS